MDPLSGIRRGFLGRYCGLLHNLSGAWIYGPLHGERDHSLVTGLTAWVLGQPGIWGLKAPGWRNRRFSSLVAPKLVPVQNLCSRSRKTRRKFPKSGTLKTILFVDVVYNSQCATLRRPRNQGHVFFPNHEPRFPGPVCSCLGETSSWKLCSLSLRC